MSEHFPAIGDLTPQKAPRKKKKPHEVIRMTKAQRAVFVKLGHKGGTMRAKNRTAKELSAIGKQGAGARWGKRKKK